MSTIIIPDKEENNKTVPTFSGSARAQDPLKFIEDFQKAAKWNNWRTDERKKETFLMCLNGHAERWVKNHLMADKEMFKVLEFEPESGEGLLSLFKEQYVTEDWYELYTKEYEDRKQSSQETPLEYLEAKRDLFQRAGPECGERSKKQQVRDIMKGLVPQVAKFCDQKLKDPFNQAARTTAVTVEGVEKLLKWAEQCLYEDRKVSCSSVGHDDGINNVSTAPRRVQFKNTADGPTYQRHETSTLNHKKINNLTEFEQRVLNKLDKLDLIENEIAVIKDRIDILEKGPKTNQGYANAANYKKGIKCFNCEDTGHFARECPNPCSKCENANHPADNCPKRLQAYQDRMKRQVNNVDTQDFQQSLPLV